MKVNFQKVVDFIKKEAGIVADFLKFHITDAIQLGTVINGIVKDPKSVNILTVASLVGSLTHRKVETDEISEFENAFKLAMQDLGYNLSTDLNQNLNMLIGSLVSAPNKSSKSMLLSKLVSRLLAHLDDNTEDAATYDHLTTMAYKYPDAFTPSTFDNVNTQPMQGTNQTPAPAPTPAPATPQEPTPTAPSQDAVNPSA